MRIILFLSASLLSSLWLFSTSSKWAISFSRFMIARLSFYLSSLTAYSFACRCNLLVRFKSRLLLLFEARQIVSKALSLTWDVVRRFDGICYPCRYAQSQISFLHNCGLSWLHFTIDEFGEAIAVEWISYTLWTETLQIFPIQSRLEGLLCKLFGRYCSLSQSFNQKFIKSSVLSPFICGIFFTVTLSHSRALMKSRVIGELTKKNTYSLLSSSISAQKSIVQYL